MTKHALAGSATKPLPLLHPATSEGAETTLGRAGLLWHVIALMSFYPPTLRNEL